MQEKQIQNKLISRRYSHNSSPPAEFQVNASLVSIESFYLRFLVEKG